MALEVLKPINGYEGLYSISNKGRVYSHIRGVYLKNNLLSSGYEQVTLLINSFRKTFNIHKLVALHFVPGYKEGLVVNHIDEDKGNNEFKNLEWVTRQYNTEYSLARKYLITLPTGKTLVILNLKRYCRDNNLSQGNMCAVLRGERLHHKHYGVKYYGSK